MQFLLALVIAALLGSAAAFLSVRITGGVIRAKTENSEYVEQNIQNRVNEFQTFVTENGLSTKNTEQISDWVRDRQNVVLAISDGDNIIYDSTDFRFKGNGGKGRPPLTAAYTVHFFDTDADVHLFELLEFKYIAISHYFSIFVGIIVFLIFFIIFIQKKVSYITRLEKDVNILESGDLDHKLTVKGNDELTYLAKSIDDMRLSIINREKEKEQTEFAKHKLVTAMSHDLRTPLTVLIGLLEIMDGKKYKDEEELHGYIYKAKEKSYRIKELSDKIFEYFFAFDIKENDMDKQVYKTNVIYTMIEDYIFAFTEKGYTFKTDLADINAVTELDIKLFSRVIDNIFSNILKYADIAESINVTSRAENNILKLTFKNKKIKNAAKEESTNIGTEICRNIAGRHNGTFEINEDEGYYAAVLSLPVKGN